MVAFPARPKIAYGDVAAIAETVRPIITPWYKGWVHIFNPNDNTGTGIDIDAGPGATDITINPYWSGPARIQPIRNLLLSKETTNDTQVRTVLFQLGYAKDGTLPDVRPGHQIVVSNGGNNQLLMLFQYVVSGSLNATGAWNHTIFATTNLETRPNYSFGDALFPAEDLFPDEDVFPGA